MLGIRRHTSRKHFRRNPAQITQTISYLIYVHQLRNRRKIAGNERMFFMQFSEIWDRERGNIVMVVITLAAVVFANSIDFLHLFIWLKNDNAVLAAYGVLGIFLSLIWSLFYESVFVLSRVKFKTNDMGHSEILQPPLRGSNFYGLLDVEIPKNWVITDCYITLEKSVMVYNEDRVLLDSKFTTWLASKTKPEYKILRWKSRYSNEQDGKLNIGENSNIESVLVGKIINGSLKDPKGKKTEIKTFSFPFCGDHPTMVQFNRLGLRIISLKLHWTRNGRRMITKKFDGYIYCESAGGRSEIFVRPGDYTKDKDIPIPLLKSKNLINEKTKVVKRKAKNTSKKTAA